MHVKYALMVLSTCIHVSVCVYLCVFHSDSESLGLQEPIRGERWKCQDCGAVPGYDLCGNCYDTFISGRGKLYMYSGLQNKLGLAQRFSTDFCTSLLLEKSLKTIEKVSIILQSAVQIRKIWMEMIKSEFDHVHLPYTYIHTHRMNYYASQSAIERESCSCIHYFNAQGQAHARMKFWTFVCFSGRFHPRFHRFSWCQPPKTFY